jgi:hypothetical protein
MEAISFVALCLMLLALAVLSLAVAVLCLLGRERDVGKELDDLAAAVKEQAAVHGSVIKALVEGLADQAQAAALAKVVRANTAELEEALTQAAPMSAPPA